MITYEYNIYRSPRNRYLDQMLAEAAFVWNHALAIQKRYHSLFGGYINLTRIQHHFAKRISRCRLGAQTVQEILERLDAAYQRFFVKLAKRPPKFKKASKFASFVFKQDGFKLNANILVINKIKKNFKFSNSRPYEGKVKQVRVKRTLHGGYCLYIVTDASPKPYCKTHDGAAVGMDFGLKHFLTLSNGSVIESPLFLKKELKTLQRINRSYSRAQCKWNFLGKNGNPVKGSRIVWESNHRKALKASLSREQERIANLREDWQ